MGWDDKRWCRVCGGLHNYKGPCEQCIGAVQVSRDPDKDLKAMLPKIDQYNMTATFEGFSSHDIKHMVEYMYGAVMWEYMEDGQSVVCYPTSMGKVTVKHQEPT